VTKTIAIRAPGTELREALTARGYQVIELTEASRTHCHIDALLLTAFCPENITSCHQSLDASDIAIGSVYPAQDDLPHTIVLNITGMYPEQVVDSLERHLRHRRWSH